MQPGHGPSDSATIHAMERIKPTEEDGYEALRQHIVERALLCRERYGHDIDWPTLKRILEDRDFVRFPVHVRFADEPLMRGEFANPSPFGDRAAEGFELCIRPCFKDDEASLVPLVLYHIPSINYLDIATNVEAELFGATMLGIEVEQYYARVCAVADRMPEEFRLSAEEVEEAATMQRHLDAAAEAEGAAETAGTDSGCGSCS